VPWALGVYRGPPEVYRGPCMKITPWNSYIIFTAVPFQDANFIVKLFFYFSCFIATNFLVNKDVCVVEILMFPISYQRMQPMPAIRSITGEDSQSVQLI